MEKIDISAGDYSPPPKQPGFFAALFGAMAGVNMARGPIKSGITVAVTVTVPTAHHTTDTDMGAGIMAMTMCTDVNSLEIKAAAVWIDGHSHNKGHETI